MINMTKHTDYGSPSIMEPVDETPSLTLTSDLIDAMKTDFHFDKPQLALPTTTSVNLSAAPSSTPSRRSAPLSAPITSATIDHLADAISELDRTPIRFQSSSTHRPIPPTHHIELDRTPIRFQSSSTHRTIPPIHHIEQLKSINMHYENSFLLMDGNEELHVPSADFFCKRLGCTTDTKLKVVTIFGNTGDGKSHTMNNAFFGGEEIFRTSAEQDSCTLGVWAAHQPELGVLCLDTEGLLGDTPKPSTRMRMLLKVLAISDIIIYRTRSERLHSDMFEFLGMASKAFHAHFSAALQSMGLPGPAQSLGPAVLIFHETRNTKIIEATHEKSPEDILRERFAQMKIELESFSSLRYIGLQTTRPPTLYGCIQNAINREIMNTAVRSPRQPAVIYQAIDLLNMKFSGKINEKTINPFPEQYFTCGVHCESCDERCDQSMGHTVDGRPHTNSKPCRYQHQYENKVFLCRQCHTNGREVVVKITAHNSNEQSWYGLAKYAWSGSVIECPNCGEIFRARQYWYGNKVPEDIAVRTDIVHVWPNNMLSKDGPTYSAQMVLDSVNYLTETVYNISAQPSKALTGWVTDKMAPSYWRPNAEIIVCNACKLNFERSELRKHHCRGCGEGFCNACSMHKMAVPSRGWSEPVRVCVACKDILLRHAVARPDSHIDKNTNGAGGEGGAGGSSSSNEEPDVTVRKYGEVFLSTLSSVAALVEYPKDLIKDSARPSYWVPDNESPECTVCQQPFGTAEELTAAVSSNHRRAMCNRTRHHCRACGLAVCNPCSMGRRSVPERGWSTEVRVCDQCNKKSKSD